MKYYLAHNGKDVFNYGTIAEDQNIESMQPFLRIFNTIDELKFELSIYGMEMDDITYDLPQDLPQDSPQIEY